MASVFISYSRRDREFVRRLNEALAVRQRDTWVDWEDIPPTAEWLREIYAAIEGANTFLFILSPDSATSEVCLKELAHAVSHHKRLIPVVCRDVTSKDVPESLSKLNWIFLLENDDFDAGVEKLLEAVDTDLDWVKAHTRLLIRAVEWDKQPESRHKKSLLLQGSDLKHAEAWLTQIGNQKPHPTELQRAYILASRQGEIRRKRLLWASFLIGVLAVTVVATVAIYQYRISRSRHLAAQTQPLLDHHEFDLALLLSVEALRVSHTQEAQEALLTASQNEPRIKTMFHLHEAYVSGLAFGPEGKTLISGSAYKGISFWDLNTYRTIGQPLKGDGRKVECVAFDGEGIRLASSNGGLITVWDLLNRQVLTRIRAIEDWDGNNRFWTEGYKPFVTGPDVVISLAFSPDGRVLASGTRDGAVVLWELKTCQALCQPLKGHKEYVISLAFSPDGKILASGSRDDTVMLWDLQAQQPLRAPLTGHTSAVTGLVFSPDGRTLVSASTDKTIILWDSRTATPQSPPLTGHQEGVTSLAYAPDGQTLASGSADGAIILWDLKTRKPLDSPLKAHEKGVSTLVFSPDGANLASVFWDDSIILWDTHMRKGSGEPLRGHRKNINQVAFSPDGQMLASASDDHTVILWDSKTREPLGPPLAGHRDAVGSLAFSPDGTILATGGGIDDPRILIWSARSGSPLAPPLQGHENFIHSLTFSPDGQTLASGSRDETIILWDVESRKPLGSPLKGHEGNVFSVAFSPDGQTLASGGYDEVIILWDLKTRQQLGLPLEGHKGDVSTVAFSPDGQTLASGSTDATVILWDVQTRQPLGPPLKEPYPVYSVAFSPDGTVLAAGGADGAIYNQRGTVTLWDLKTRQPLSPPLKVPDYRVRSVAFSPDGQTLVSGSEGTETKGSIMFWDVRTRQPLGPPLMSQEEDPASTIDKSNLKQCSQRACRIANRNLTREEWRKYMGAFLPYRKTCPELPGPEE